MCLHQDVFLPKNWDIKLAENFMMQSADLDRSALRVFTGLVRHFGSRKRTPRRTAKAALYLTSPARRFGFRLLPQGLTFENNRRYPRRREHPR